MIQCPDKALQEEDAIVKANSRDRISRHDGPLHRPAGFEGSVLTLTDVSGFQVLPQ